MISLKIVNKDLGEGIVSGSQRSLKYDLQLLSNVRQIIIMNYDIRRHTIIMISATILLACNINYLLKISKHLLH